MIPLLATEIWAAMFALAGTIVGGLVAGGIQLVVARISRTTQNEGLKLEAAHEAARVWRDERRRIYAGFLTVTSRAARQYWAYGELAPGDPNLPGVDVYRAVRDECYTPYSDLTLVASREVRAIALELLSFIEECCFACEIDAALPERPSSISSEAVLSAMQRDLGLERADAPPAPSP